MNILQILCFGGIALVTLAIMVLAWRVPANPKIHWIDVAKYRDRFKDG